MPKPPSFFSTWPLKASKIEAHGATDYALTRKDAALKLGFVTKHDHL